jgi:hypothetical protein
LRAQDIPTRDAALPTSPLTNLFFGRIDGDPYWIGGIHSNTPIEVVLDDNPRHDSIAFADQM